MDEDNEETYEPLPATPMQGLDLVILATDCIGGVVRVAASFWNDLVTILGSHANYKIEKRNMENRARMEIEMLVSGE